MTVGCALMFTFPEICAQVGPRALVQPPSLEVDAGEVPRERGEHLRLALVDRAAARDAHDADREPRRAEPEDGAHRRARDRGRARRPGRRHVRDAQRGVAGHRHVGEPVRRARAEDRLHVGARPDTVPSRGRRAVDLGVHRPPGVVGRDVVERVVHAREVRDRRCRPTRGASPPSGRPRWRRRTSWRPRLPRRAPSRRSRRPRRWKKQPRRSGRRRPGRACRGT